MNRTRKIAICSSAAALALLGAFSVQMHGRLDGFFRERKLRLCDLDPKHIRELHQSIFAYGCNANTVIHYHAILRKALQYAVKNELVPSNVADKVDRPKKSEISGALL